MFGSTFQKVEPNILLKIYNLLFISFYYQVDILYNLNIFKRFKNNTINSIK